MTGVTQGRHRMDGLPHEHRVTEAQETRERGCGFLFARVLGRRKARAGATAAKSDAAEGSSIAGLRHSLDLFLTIPPWRTGAAARRLAFVGRLTPETGAADLLWAAEAWAERYCEQTIRILWVGEGDLKDVLIAQPVAENLVQKFLPVPSPPQLAAVLSRCGMLVAPTLAEGTVSLISAAMAAGLPVLASSRQPGAAQWVLHGRTGWLFDPLVPGALALVLERALATPDAVLDRMRELVRQLAAADGNLSMVPVTRRLPVAPAPAGEPVYDLG